MGTEGIAPIPIGRGGSGLRRVGCSQGDLISTDTPLCSSPWAALGGEKPKQVTPGKYSAPKVSVWSLGPGHKVALSSHEASWWQRGSASVALYP